MAKLSYQLASWPEEDVVVAEIFLDSEDVGHIARHGERLDFTLYRAQPHNLELEVSELEALLRAVRQRLA